MNNKSLKQNDLELWKTIDGEKHRQQNHIELIASENFVSPAVLAAQGSVMTNKYAEGYPGKRYYGGCEWVDQAELLAIKRACQLFGCEFANVQPHSGSQANMAAYRAILAPGDLVLGMALDHGGHLTHGHALSFSGQDYKFVPYFLNSETETLDYQEILHLAKTLQPKLIVAGASAYSREIDFKELRAIADQVGAYLMVDMAHIAGLVAAGLHCNPIPHADIVTTTTHKTLRGPRGGMILTNNENLAKKINTNVFPGVQGGPLMHIIAAKAVCFHEALQPEFIEYQKQVIKNARTMAGEFIRRGYHVVSGGTDNHLFMIDVKKQHGISGKLAQDILDSVNITTNKNSIPNDSEKPFITSGLRLGTPAITTRGLCEAECLEVVRLIDEALINYQNKKVLKNIRTQVVKLIAGFPLPY